MTTPPIKTRLLQSRTVIKKILQQTAVVGFLFFHSHVSHAQGFMDQLEPVPSQVNELPRAMLPGYARMMESQRLFSESDFGQGGLVDYFPVVIWINKSSSGETPQTIRIYDQGKKVFEDRVSTGREKWELTPNGTKYFSSTSTGYYVPYWLDKNHVSNLWNTPMPWAVFFDGGIAIHQVPKGADGKLGSRASGGCVRVKGDVAQYIYQLIEYYGRGTYPLFSSSGNIRLDQNGRPTMKQGYRALIIVENRQDQP